MSSWTTPKTDWDLTDYYNYSDLNRVESNTEYVYDQLIAIGYAISVLTLVKTRTKSSIEYYDSLNRIESNILALKTASFEPLGWETPKIDWVSVIDTFGYTDANRLESNLLTLKTMIENIVAAFLYCGQANFYCGNKVTAL